MKLTVNKTFFSKNCRRVLHASGVTATIFVFASTAVAKDYCSTMEIYLSNLNKHRKDVTEFIAPKIKAKFGTDLVMEEMGSAAMIEKITAQGDKPRVTLMFPDFAASAVPCETLCAPIDVSKISSIDSYPKSARLLSKSGDLVGIGTAVNAVGLVYNEEEFSKRNLPAPTSWKDLERPDLAGRVSITSPVSMYGTAIVASFSELGGAAPGNYDIGFEKVKAIQPNLHGVHTFSGELGNLLQLKEVWLTTAGTSIVPALRANGVPVKFVAPVEGALLVQNGVHMIKGAPCQEEAYEFLNIYLGDEFQALRATTASNITPSTTAWKLVSPEVIANLPLNPSQISTLTDLDWRALGPNRAAIIERWQREIR